MLNSFRQLSADIEAMIRTTHGDLIVKRHPILRLVPEQHRLGHQTNILLTINMVLLATLCFSALLLLETYESWMLPEQVGMTFIGLIVLSMLALPVVENLSKRRWQAHLHDIDTAERNNIARTLLQIASDCRKAAMMPEAFSEVPVRKAGNRALVQTLIFELNQLSYMARTHAAGILSDDKSANIRALEFLLTGDHGTLTRRLKAIKHTLRSPSDHDKHESATEKDAEAMARLHELEDAMKAGSEGS